MLKYAEQPNIMVYTSLTGSWRLVY